MAAEQMGLWVVTEETPPNGHHEPETPQGFREATQAPLIDIGEWWEEHWKGMPEFVQKDLAPYKTIYVHFETRKDMEAFAELVGQKIGLNTRSVWYPEAEIGHFADKRYIDEPPVREPGEDDVEVLDEG